MKNKEKPRKSAEFSGRAAASTVTLLEAAIPYLKKVWSFMGVESQEHIVIDNSWRGVEADECSRLFRDIDANSDGVAHFRRRDVRETEGASYFLRNAEGVNESWEIAESPVQDPTA